ncbi:MAG: hypothetical protein GF331_08080, partial [Chitinivibrionales bacterium]|nr:hypothetical protein [Chitinivibrionales bacterium]
MRALVRRIRDEEQTVTSMLLGQNLEMTYTIDRGVLANRIDNPHFAGPVDPRFQLAEGWTSWASTNFQGIRYEHVPVGGLNGNAAQVLNNFGGTTGAGIMQRDVPVRAGEQLEVFVWARAQSHPVDISVSLRPLSLSHPAYAEETLHVGTAWYASYRTVLQVEADDDNAVFVVRPLGEG